MAWRNSDSVFVATDFGPGSLTTSGYPRIVKEWKRGTPLAAAELVFEAKPDDMSVDRFSRPHAGLRARRRGPPADVLDQRDVSCGVTASSVKIDKPDDARASFYREWLLLQLRSDWTVGGKTYPAGALIATNLEAFLNGERAFDVLFEPAERKSLVGFSPTRHHILLTELDNVRSRDLRAGRIAKDDGIATRCRACPSLAR